MNKPGRDDGRALPGWLALVVVLFVLAGWGVVSYLDGRVESKKEAVTVKQTVAEREPVTPVSTQKERSPVPDDAPKSSVTLRNGLDLGSLRLTLAETIRLPKPPAHHTALPGQPSPLAEGVPRSAQPVNQSAAVTPAPPPLLPSAGQPSTAGPAAPQPAEPPSAPPLEPFPVRVAPVPAQTAVPPPPVRQPAAPSSAEVTVSPAPTAERASSQPIKPPLSMHGSGSGDTVHYEEPLPKTGKKLHGETPVVPPILPEEKKDGRFHTLALIIDDLGYNLPIAQGIMALSADLTLAILPRLPHSRQIARMGKQTGREMLLHQPMEPQRYPQTNPGPGAILASMERADMQAVLRTNLDLFPEVVGINNHMGSRLTEQSDAMDAVMAVLSEKKLFFIDSRTSDSSVGFARAMANQVPSAVRHVFIDNVPEEGAILRQLAQLEHMAHKPGNAIGIGHPYRETLTALQHWLPTLAHKGIHLVRVSRLIRPAMARALYPGQGEAAAR
ncbi:MAG: divergent polysaccharide deacetylase family protein [Magnetococcales bacterium]|nr:divergent polysaccharide deacetylase family protein [Magnetococcales bacterium]